MDSPTVPSTGAQDLADMLVDSGMARYPCFVMSVDYRVVAVETYLRLTPGTGDALDLATGPTGFRSVVNAPGQRGNPQEALPANCPLALRFIQSAFGAKHNGRCYISGISESDTMGGVITAGLRQAIEIDVINAWPLGFNNGPNGSTFRHVLMCKPRLPNGDPDNWQNARYGTSADVVGVGYHPILVTQRRRTTRYEGPRLGGF